MSQEQFEVLLPVIVADFIKLIIEEKNIDSQKAIALLYNSKLYALIENEETKLWQYSTPRLMTLLNQELETGTIEFADV